MTGDQHLSSGVFAVDGLEPEEREVYLRHVAGCPDCQDEVASFYETLAELAQPVPLSLDRAELTRHAVDQMAQVRPLVDRSDPNELVDPIALAPRRQRSAPERRWRIPAALVAGAAAAWLLAFGFSFDRPGSESSDAIAIAQLSPDADGIDALLTSSDSRMVTLDAVKASEGPVVRVVSSDSMGRGYLVATGLGDIGPDQTYELWAVGSDGRPVAVALFVPNPEGDVGVLFATSVSGGGKSGWAVTVEPIGGSTHPTGGVRYADGSHGMQADN